MLGTRCFSKEADNFTSNSGYLCGIGPREPDRKAPRLRLLRMWCQRGPRGMLLCGEGSQDEVDMSKWSWGMGEGDFPDRTKQRQN